MKIKAQQGYAAIMTTLLTLVVSLTVISAFTFFAMQEVAINRAYVRSVDAHAIAESGIEDAAYRVITNKQIAASQNLNVGNGMTTVTMTIAGNMRTIRSEGLKDVFQNNMETTIDVNTQGVNFFYGVQVGDGGLAMSNNSTVNGNIYSNGSILGASGATITGDAVVAGGINTNPDIEWTNNSADQFFATANGNRDIAQSFIPLSTGGVPKVSVYLARVGNPSSAITLRLTTDNSNKPNNSSIASATIQPSSVGTSPSWIDVAFSSPPSITAGTKYWIVLDYGSSSGSDFWNWRKDPTDNYTKNTGKYTSNWSSGGAVWTNVGGDLDFKVWVGGANTKIQDVTIGTATSGTGHANLFINDTIHGSACPNSYCIVENPPREELPISDGVIQDWKDNAIAPPGHVCGIPDGCDASGNMNVTGTKSLGPIKIPGTLTVTNGAHLIVTGTIWVVGDITMSNNCIVELASSYGALSGVILSEQEIDVSNNCSFDGSGQSGSYIMLLSDKNAPTSDVIDVSNNSLGVIYYASKGKIHLNNNAAAKEVTAYGVDMDNNATITYESGLANAQFSSGPSGGYIIRQWHEVP